MPDTLVQPLPQDLCDRSFRGMDCEGWDFSGRDIRGCDFSNAVLNSADFTGAIAGRSIKQNINDIVILVASAVLASAAVTVIFSLAGPIVVIFTVVFAFLVTVLMLVIIAFAGLSANIVVGAGTFAGTFAVAGVGAGGGMALRAIDFFSMDRIFEGCLFSSIAMVCFYIAFTFVQEAIKVFREAIGTNFQGAILSNANFSDAKLDNCKFDRADISDVNWRGVKGGRSTIDFNNMQ